MYFFHFHHRTASGRAVKGTRHTLVVVAVTALSILCFFIGLFFLVVMGWLTKKFGDVDLNQLIFNLRNPMTGADREVVISAWLTFSFAVVVPALGMLLYAVNPWKCITCLIHIVHVIIQFVFSLLENRRFLCITLASLILFLTGISIFICRFSVVKALKLSYSKTTLFDEYCYLPEPEDVSFPEKKNNLVLIFLESMENTYKDKNICKENCIPELALLQHQNHSFSRQLEVYGTNWTAAGIISVLYGMPHLNLWGASSDGKRKFKVFPRVSSILNILSSKGYQILSMRGSSMRYAGMITITQDVENCRTLGLENLSDIPEYRSIPGELRHTLGIHDEILLEIAKKELSKMAGSKKPFCLVLESVNTHGYSGYLPPEYQGKRSFDQVLRLNSKLFGDFISYLQKQPYASDTTIVLIGDHLAMKNPFDRYLSNGQKLPAPLGKRSKPLRTIYNCFINPVFFPADTVTDKYCATFDLAPTILESLGARWKNHRFGIGTSLLSDAPNLFAKYTPQEYEEEVQKRSGLYCSLFTGK